MRGAKVLPNDPVNPTNNFGNRKFNTGIEFLLHNCINDLNFTVVGQLRPVDGGFGTNPVGGFGTLLEQPGFTNENFGNQTFNTVSLIEAADIARENHLQNTQTHLQNAVNLMRF